MDIKIMKTVFESDVYKELEKNPAQYTIPYMKQWGPIIEVSNIKDLLEQLMVDYLLKKDIITTYYEKYHPKRNDYEQMSIFEKELQSRLGKRPLTVDFLTIDPSKNVKEQFENILSNKDFEYFLI